MPRDLMAVRWVVHHGRADDEGGGAWRRATASFGGALADAVALAVVILAAVQSASGSATTSHSSSSESGGGAALEASSSLVENRASRNTTTVAFSNLSDDALALAGAATVFTPFQVSSATTVRPLTAGGGGADVAASFMHMRLALTITHLLLVSLGSVNLLVIFVIMLRPYMRSITNVYMLSLCLADFIYLVNLSLVAATQLNDKSWPFGTLMCTLYHGTETTGKYASVLFVVLLAVDRYCAMCRASSCARYRNFRVAIAVSVVAWTAAIGAAFPLYYFAEVALLRFRNVRKAHKLCIAKWPNSDTARWYITVSSVLIFALPLVLIIYCYYHILNKMREALKSCRRMRRGARSRAPYHRVTRLVLWVVVFHVICWSPFWLFNLFSSIFRLRISTQFDRIVVNIIHLFPYINCALNPLLYATHAENFRVAFRSIFCRFADDSSAALEAPSRQTPSSGPPCVEHRGYATDCMSAENGGGTSATSFRRPSASVNSVAAAAENGYVSATAPALYRRNPSPAPQTVPPHQPHHYQQQQQELCFCSQDQRDVESGRECVHNNSFSNNNNNSYNNNSIKSGGRARPKTGSLTSSRSSSGKQQRFRQPQQKQQEQKTHKNSSATAGRHHSIFRDESPPPDVSALSRRQRISKFLRSRSGAGKSSIRSVNNGAAVAQSKTLVYNNNNNNNNNSNNKGGKKTNVFLPIGFFCRSRRKRDGAANGSTAAATAKVLDSEKKRPFTVDRPSPAVVKTTTPASVTNTVATGEEDALETQPLMTAASSIGSAAATPRTSGSCYADVMI